MLYIDETLPNVIKAKSEHIRYVTCRINKKFYDENCSDKKCGVCNHTQKVKTLSPKLQELSLLIRHDEVQQMIIGGRPEDLYFMSDFLWKSLLPGFSWAGYSDYERISKKKNGRTPLEQTHYDLYNEVKKAFAAAFEYDNWFGGDKNDRYDAYWLARNLNRNTCTYCNRIYTHTVDKKKHGKVTRPQFDHWFSKAKHPALALSFYNLIPSCSTCNSSVKGTLDFNLVTHLHPYTDADCDDKFLYSYHYDRSTRRYHIDILPTDPTDIKTITTFRELKLKEVFDTHYSELAELIQIKKAYSTKYIQKLKQAFPKMNLSNEEVYRLVFGVEFDRVDFYKKPLSKFKKDILKELKLVK